MNKYPSAYDRIKWFIENELHINLTFYKKMILKNMLDKNIQKHLKELYEGE